MAVRESLVSDSNPITAPAQSILSRPNGSWLPDLSDYLSDTDVNANSETGPSRFRFHAPGSASDALKKATIQTIEDDTQSEISRAEALTQRFPASSTAWARLAQLLASLGRFTDALEPSRQALEMIKLSSARQEDGVSIDQASGFIAARILLGSGLLSEVEEFFACFSELPVAWQLLNASISEGQSHYDEALRRLDGAQGAEAENYRGYLLLHRGQWREAIVALREAGGESSGNPVLLMNLAYAYSLAGSQKKALKSARQAALLAPRNPVFSLGLVGHLVGNSKLDEAYKELKRIQSEVGDEPKIGSTMAFVLGQSGEFSKARKEVRRILNNTVFNRPLLDYSELVVDLALIELKVGIRTLSDVIQEIRKQIRIVEGQSLRMAISLSNLLHLTTDRAEVAALYKKLRDERTEEELLPLKLRIDFLSLDDAAALQDAIAWADSSPLNPDALQTLMTVRGHAFGDLNGAIRLGWQSLRRIPGSALVRNSLAFYLALDGQSAEAWRMLKDAEGNKFPLFYATQGLVAFGRGDVDEGLESYDKAINTARRSSSDQRQILEFEQLARVYEWVALSRFGLYGGEMKERCPFELPSDWKQDLHYLQVHRLAVSLGLTWPTQFED